MTPDRNLLGAASLLLGALLFAGCGRKADAPLAAEGGGAAPAKVVLQTDWFAQAEHGGFYQAELEGIYARRGLDVEIRQGGPNAVVYQRLVLGEVQFANANLADAIAARARGLPILVVGAYMQRNPQALLVHEESGIRSFKDLEGRRVMAGTGSAWIEAVRRREGVRFDILPLDFGMERFLADKEFVQQCFATSEPFYARQQGANPRALLIADSGFDPYRVIVTREDFARENPEIVRAFVAASLEGWRDFLFGDRSRALARIGELNPKQTPEFTAFSVGAMLELGLVTGPGSGPEGIGRMTEARLRETAADLAAVGMTERELKVPEFATLEFVPAPFPPLHGIPRPQVVLHPGRADDTDLAVTARWDGPGGEPSTRHVRRADLLARPEASVFELPVEFRRNAVHPVKGIALRDLEAILGLRAGGDVIIADCGDGYQAFVDRGQVSELGPVLILEIDGEGPESWGRRDGAWRHGPWAVALQSDGGLPDPGSKQPFGVTGLTWDVRADRFAVFEVGKAATLDEAGLRGRQLYVNHCLSCHGSAAGGIGGRLSSRPLEVVAAIARHNPDHFVAVVRDPSTVMPGIAMGPHPHYTDSDLAALRTFLDAFTP